MITPSATANPTILHELVIDGETVLFLGETTLVKSKSTDGAWYEVRDGRCTCPGFTHRGRCRHIAPAQLAAEYDRAHAVPVVANEPVTTSGVDSDGMTFIAIWQGPGEPPTDGPFAEYFRPATRPAPRTSTRDLLWMPEE